MLLGMQETAETVEMVEVTAEAMAEEIMVAAVGTWGVVIWVAEVIWAVAACNCVLTERAEE